MSGSPVRKAVIPAAGLGTRFLPVTKAVPKEMLPLVDKPSIQYVVEEAARVGIDDVLLVTSRTKGAIEDHFRPNEALEAHLADGDKLDLLEEVRSLTGLASVSSVYQDDPHGLGHAVSIARDHVAGESFAVLLGDDVMIDDGALLGRMLDVHGREGASVLALLEVEPADISKYGCAEVDPVGDGVVRVRSVVEKPPPSEAPSNLAVIGRYVLTPGIFAALDRTPTGVGGELQLTDGIGLLMDDEPVFGVVFSEGRYDIGKKVDFLRANLDLALERPDLGPEVREMLAELVRARGIA